MTGTAGRPILLTFDRGTLLLERSETTVDDDDGIPAAPAHRDLPQGEPELLRLVGVRWDARIGCHRAPAWMYAEILARARALGIRLVDEARVDWPVDGCWAPVLLRSYQQAALMAWELGGRRGLIALPTGSGKTRVALAAMAALGAPALCLVPTRVLLHQWRTEIARHYAGPIGCLGDGTHDLAPVCVATFESAYRSMDRIGAHFGLLVVDEAHHFGRGNRDEALEMAIAPARLGLSATPPSEPVSAARLAELVGPPIYDMSVTELAGSYLADFRVVVLSLPLDEEERAAYEREIAAFRAAFVAYRQIRGMVSWQDFVSTASRTAQGRAALASWRTSRRLVSFTRAKAAALRELLERHRHCRVLVFTADNRTAYAVARRHLLMPITCDIGRAERDAALDAFRSGQLRALVSSRVLNEGLDVPDADVAIVLGGTQGEREHVQRVGRLLRPAPGKHALIYELIASGTIEVRQAARRRRGFRPKGMAA